MPLESATHSEFATSSAQPGNRKFLVPFILVISLFFLWGLVHNLNSSLIPHLKKACELNNRQSTLIDTAIFLAYFLMAIPAGMILKKWIKFRETKNVKALSTLTKFYTTPTHPATLSPA